MCCTGVLTEENLSRHLEPLAVPGSDSGQEVALERALLPKRCVPCPGGVQLIHDTMGTSQELCATGTSWQSLNKEPNPADQPSAALSGEIRAWLN